MLTRTAAVLLATLAVATLTNAACGDAQDAAPPVKPTPATDTKPSTHAVPEPATGIPRHAEDGGWAPSDELLARAAALGDPETAVEALAALEAGTPVDWVTVLRAGLRLADEPAARACAEQLNWDQVDGWESARVVALLPASYTLAQGKGHVFHGLREILGSDDIPGFVADLPPLPWVHEPNILGHLHRMDRDEHFPAMVAAIARVEAPAADVLGGNLGVASDYSDRHRALLAEHWLADLPLHDDDRNPPEGSLPTGLRRLLRAHVLDAEVVPEKLSDYWLRWLRDCPLEADGPQEDLDFRMEVLERLDDAAGLALFREQMMLHLGGLRDRRTDAYLRRRFDDDDESAVRALALRGDPLALESVMRWWSDDSADDVDVAVLLAAHPAGITKILERTRRKRGAGALYDRLEDLREGVYAAHMFGLPYDLDGPAFRALEEEALTWKGEAFSQAMLGTAIDGCRTRRLARAAAANLAEDSPDDLAESLADMRETLGFVEIGARDELLAALRQHALAENPEDPDERTALRLLLMLDDPEFPEELLTRAEAVEIDDTFGVTGSRSPVLAEHWKSRLRDASPKRASTIARELARWQGLPPPVAANFDSEEDLPRTVVDALLDDRPVDALAAMLAAYPDAEFPDIGLVKDPRVTAHLQRLREKRELRLYWQATAELSIQGDAAARAEYEKQLRIGRYRIVDQGTLYQRTYGLDFATIPFLISELRSNCCRVVTHGDGDLIEDLFGIDGFGNATRGRVTPYDLATRMWEDAEGRFVWSVLADRLLPIPR